MASGAQPHAGESCRPGVPGESYLQGELEKVVKKEDGRPQMGSAMVSERVSQQAEKASGSFRPQGLPAGWGLGWKPPSSFELQVGALSRERMGRAGWGDDGVGGEPTECTEDACWFLPRLLCRAGAWALSSRSTACTLRWRSSSTSGVGGGGGGGREAFRLGALRLSCPSLTLPTSSFPENVFSLFFEPQKEPRSNQLRAGSLHPGQGWKTAF